MSNEVVGAAAGAADMFRAGVRLDTSAGVEKHAGTAGKELSYLPWAASLGLARCPLVKVVDFARPDGAVSPVLPIFGGTVVAAELDGQRVYLPVQNDSFQPIPAGKESARDISDSQARVRAKVIAAVRGVGLSLYADFGGDGERFYQAVGGEKITKDGDLATVPAMVSGKKRGRGDNAPTTDYLGWPQAIAAAAMGADDFKWVIGEFDVGHADANGEIVSTTRELYRQWGNGYAVAVTVRFRGREHTETLPIMGVVEVQTRNGPRSMDNQPLLRPNVNNWNKSVMRCLSKAIAVISGYGLSIYAKMEFAADEQGGPVAAEATAEPAAAKQTPVSANVTPIRRPAEVQHAARAPAQQHQQQAAGSAVVSSRGDALTEIADLISLTGVEVDKIEEYLGGKKIVQASNEQLVAVLTTLRGKAARGVRAAKRA